MRKSYELKMLFDNKKSCLVIKYHTTGYESHFGL